MADDDKEPIGFRIDGLGVTPESIREIGAQIMRDVAPAPGVGELVTSNMSDFLGQMSALLASQITPVVARTFAIENMFDVVLTTANSAELVMTAKGGGRGASMQSSTSLTAQATVVSRHHSPLCRDDLVDAIQQATSVLVNISLKLAPTDAARFTALVTFLTFLLLVWDHVNP